MEARVYGRSDSDENYDLGYQFSPSQFFSVDRQSEKSSSSAETATFSSTRAESFVFCRTNSENSEHTDSCSDNSTLSPLSWARSKSPSRALLSRLVTRRQHKTMLFDDKPDDVDEPIDLEMEMMKERFSKLLLGEDMSGSGKGVCSAVAISNAITNLYVSVFGQHLKLEPLQPEKKLMWKREMSYLLSICDFVVELTPSSQNLHNKTTVAMMACRPRSDIHINLPALKKLDAMLLEVLDNFEQSEFWYAERGSMSGNSTRLGSFRRIIQPQRSVEKWWLPVPCVPLGGLSEKSRKHLVDKHDCVNQIHKAAMAINGTILDEMEIPDSYWADLPKSGRTSLGDAIYRYMSTSDKFFPNNLLNCLNLSSEHEALDLADRVEAAMYTWRRKACISNSKSSWKMVKDLMSETERNDKNYILAERAESLLFCLKQKYPDLSQTTLDTSKILYNKDVGQAILESYSRVLEGLAFNIVAWIDDVLFVDVTVKNQD